MSLEEEFLEHSPASDLRSGHHEGASRQVRPSTVLAGTRPDSSAPPRSRKEGWLACLAPFSENDCIVGSLEANPRARQQGDGARVVDIGANRQSCEPSTARLLELVVTAVLVVSSEHGQALQARQQCACTQPAQ